jgi:acyl carrier protein
MKTDLLLDTINKIRLKKGLESLTELMVDHDLRSDIELDSLDLAELTVKLEMQTGIDIFAKGLITKVGEVINRLNGN